jgi:hypothetical protein
MRARRSKHGESTSGLAEQLDLVQTRTAAWRKSQFHEMRQAAVLLVGFEARLRLKGRRLTNGFDIVIDIAFQHQTARIKRDMGWLFGYIETEGLL